MPRRSLAERIERKIARQPDGCWLWLAAIDKAARNARKTHCPKGHPYDERTALAVRTCRPGGRVSEPARPSYEEVVERLIRAESERAHLMRLLREIAAHDDSNASFMLAQQARIAQLEANVEKLAKKRGA